MRRGFTLIETCVTVGILVTLLAVLVPGVRTVIEASRSASCQSNLRQLALAAHSYATVFRETYPAAIVYRMTPGGMATVAWDFEQRPGGGILPGPLWQHVDTPAEVMQCPSFTGSSTFGHDPATGYNYNTTFIGAEGRFPQVGPGGTVLDGWSNVRPGLASAQCRNTQAALLGDAGWAGGTNKYMRAPMNTVEGDLLMVCAGGQAFRHLGCSHVARLDGSVHGVCTSCAGALSTPQALADVMGHPANGFLSDDDAAYDPR